MGKASYEARKRPLHSDLPEQIEVRVHRERRRRWTAAEKFGLWRRHLHLARQRSGLQNGTRSAPVCCSPGELTVKASAGFLPVQLAADGRGTPVASSEPTPCLNGMIEIEMRNGVRVGHGADLKACGAC
jgi:hypothetical protein